MVPVVAWPQAAPAKPINTELTATASVLRRKTPLRCHVCEDALFIIRTPQSLLRHRWSCLVQSRLLVHRVGVGDPPVVMAAASHATRDTCPRIHPPQRATNEKTGTRHSCGLWFRQYFAIAKKYARSVARCAVARTR